MEVILYHLLVTHIHLVAKQNRLLVYILAIILSTLLARLRQMRVLYPSVEVDWKSKQVMKLKSNKCCLL